MEKSAYKYVAERRISKLFESLMAGLMYHKPEDPIAFLHGCLDKVKADPPDLQGDNPYPWDLFVGPQRKRKAPSRVVSANTHNGTALPPVTEGRSRGSLTSSTPLPPIAGDANGVDVSPNGSAVNGTSKEGEGDYGADLARIAAIKESHPSNRMAKHFDEAYFKSLDAAGQAALLLCCRSGIENADSGMGVYAMQPADYDRFKPFFSKVLADYHGVGEDATHRNDWSLDGVAGLPADGKLDLETLGLPALSMRVRVGRNLADFPLPGAMGKEDRVELEKKMCVAFAVLQGMPEYGGGYNSLTPGHPDYISDAEYEQLVKDHIMFKDMAADPYLATAGIASDWPFGRGCYVSEDRGFIIWVGEEDHLRIMCMKKGTMLNEVFDRLRTALSVVESIEGLTFAASGDYGCVTSCPTNLGTGMRASVHIPLPNLTSDGTDTKAKTVCKPLGLSVRGTGGEHTPIGADGTCDISPRARFCITEAEIITALYTGIKLLKEKEDDPAAIAALDAAVAGPDSQGEGDYGADLARIAAIKESHPSNRMAKHFDEAYFKSLDAAGQAALLLCCRSGIENADSGMGVYAMQPADYDRFKPFFSKVLADYHGVGEDATHRNDWSLDGVAGLPADGKLDLETLGLPALSMRVRVGRNLADFPLPGAMGKEDRVELEKKMCVAFAVLQGMPEYGGGYNSLTPGHPDYISDAEYEQLVKDHIMFKDMAADPYLATAGIASDWPFGRGCYVSEDRGFIIWVGEEDHLRIMCMKKGTMLNEVFDRLRTALSVVESIEGLTFAASGDYGCVTSCPTNLGTGMRASVHIPLPNLTSDGTDTKAKTVCKPLGLSVRGTGGEHTPIGADGTCDISPRARFCITEAEIITALYTGIKLLKEKEDDPAAIAALDAAVAGPDSQGEGDYGADLARIAAIKESHPSNRMAKHFDEAYFKSLDAAGQAALLLCCRSGIENADSGMGVYAMQPADYDRFKPFFSKVLADYHGVGEDATHRNDWSLDGVAGLPADGKLDLETLGLPALSMRVRVGRNLADFPLPGAMGKEDRVELEKKMCVAFAVLQGMPEYGGGYNSLTPGHPDYISDAEYEQLVKDHIMFKDMAADPYLATAGIASDWPFGRGCYVSEDRGFIIWVGEEDHLRIMCMKKGTMLNEVFDRLRTALSVVESIEGLTFAASGDYGCVTSCPTNLGTGMRASVHIPLPNLTSDGTDTKAKTVCKPLGLSVRGTGGEHTPIGADGTCDISPRARFCITEAEIITALYTGIKLLKEKEDDPAAIAALDAAVAGPDSQGEGDYGADLARIAAIKESHPSNRMAKHFDEAYFKSLDAAGQAALLLCCRSGIENADSGMGVYAMQPADYDRFKPFFSKVLADYHGVGEDATHRNDWSLDGVAGLPADGKLDLETLGLPALSMRVRVGRNLADFPLPGAMGKEDRVELEKKMCVAFAVLQGMPEYGGGYNSLTPGHPDYISDAEYEQLVKDHIMFKDMAADPYLATAGIASDWPFGRGCYVSEDRGFIIWVGEEDHLRIMCMKKGTMLNEVFDRLRTALSVVESIEGLTFAASGDYGCVTSCPTNLGTGMRASVHIPLPNLTSDGTDTKAKTVCKPLGLSVRGTGGEHTPIGADGTCDISPRARFCITEAEIITALYTGIKLLKEKEDDPATSE